LQLRLDMIFQMAKEALETSLTISPPQLLALDTETQPSDSMMSARASIADDKVNSYFAS